MDEGGAEAAWLLNIGERWQRAVAVGDAATRDYSAPTEVRTLKWPFWRLNVPILVTGLAGTGKSMLSQAVLGRVSIASRLPTESPREEIHRIELRTAARTFRSGLVVVPGQESDQRSNALQRTTEDGAFPTGVIHCVCYGYRKIWRDTDREALSTELLARENGMLSTDDAFGLILRHYRHQEVDDFAKVCSTLEDAWGAEAGRFWLILAVTKCDLFWDRLGEVAKWYIPSAAGGGGDTTFSARLRRLMETVGSARLSVAVLPFCSYTQRYTFDSSELQATLESRLDQQRQGALVDEFKRVMGVLCDRR